MLSCGRNEHSYLLRHLQVRTDITSGFGKRVDHTKNPEINTECCRIRNVLPRFDYCV